MAYQIKFENDGRGVVVEFEGEVNGEEVLEAFDTLHKCDKKHRLRYQLWDCTKISHLQMTEDQLRYMAILEREIVNKNPGQLVVLVSEREILLGADERYNIYANVWSGFMHEAASSMKEGRHLVGIAFPELFP